MEFRVARAARITGEMLERLVREALAERDIPEPDAVVCYGSGYTGTKPSLNAKCCIFNKMEQGKVLLSWSEKSALVIASKDDMLTRVKMASPWIARKVKHTKGRDIIVCNTPKAVVRAIARGREYFTPLIESDTEYRVWVYRKRILNIYEKRLTEPEKNTKFGRNRANGWTFHRVELAAVPEDIRRASIAAVKTLALDFGAVDVLSNKGVATVLEVNTAPGVSDEHRSAIVQLTHRIVQWCANGCPERTE